MTELEQIGTIRLGRRQGFYLCHKTYSETWNLKGGEYPLFAVGYTPPGGAPPYLIANQDGFNTGYWGHGTPGNLLSDGEVTRVFSNHDATNKDIALDEGWEMVEFPPEVYRGIPKFYIRRKAIN